MTSHLHFDDLTIDLVRKNIKHLYLRVLPPSGAVRISAPRRRDLDTIRRFALSRLEWIKKQQEKIRSKAPQTPLEYIDGESCLVWGERYPLKVIASNRPASVELCEGELLLHVRPGSTSAKRQALVETWYRQKLMQALPPLIARWEPRMGVTVAHCYIRRMRTRWGSCTPRTRSLRFNIELAKKPPRCLEYLVVHEMAHLIEPSHNARFKALMDRFLPDWKHVRKELNRTPLGHEAWEE